MSLTLLVDDGSRTVKVRHEDGSEDWILRNKYEASLPKRLTTEEIARRAAVPFSNNKHRAISIILNELPDLKDRGDGKPFFEVQASRATAERLEEFRQDAASELAAAPEFVKFVLSWAETHKYASIDDLITIWGYRHDDRILIQAAGSLQEEAIQRITKEQEREQVMQ